MKKHAWNWKGGRTHNASGYVLVLCPGHPGSTTNGYVYEHRLVMEKKLRRLLQPHELVHHLNGVKHDNRLCNLKLVTINQHAREHTGPRPMSMRHAPRIYQLFKTGRTIKEIAKIVRLSCPTVSKLIKTKGWSIPNPSRAMVACRRYWRRMGVE